ncbi:MAG: glycoside hydrolase family 3 C-terminal domain-containing protein [Clostridia bacterium]|nr:glycoside hydrolase family 3 C-terminal domain-containing protein [Clostridia bacterium]
MSVIKKKVMKYVGKVVNFVTTTTSQGTSDGALGKSFVPDEEIIRLCRKVGAEGIVMLKNENNALPLTPDRTVSVFGRVQNDYFYVGYGSGGDVKAPYKVSLMEGIRNNGKIKYNELLATAYENWGKQNPVDDGFWGNWPMCYDEMPVDFSMAKTAASMSDTAIVVIGRSAGEDRENKLEKGSYYLTDIEKQVLDSVTAAFDKVVVLLNCGSIMDMAEIDAYGDKISAILYVWQTGMESGNAIADVLSGDSFPSGKLTDTIAKSYEDYPGSSDFGDRKFNNYTEDIYVGYRGFETFAKDKVIYPFGFGLGYTQFAVENVNCACENGEITVTADVKNIGESAGKEVLQLYYEAPCGRMGKPARALAAFAKTKKLLPDESETVTLRIKIADMSSYDDEETFSYILEKGTYNIYLGTDVRSAELCCTYEQEKGETVRKLSQTAAVNPECAFKRLKFIDGKQVYETVPTAKYNLKEIILENLPEATPQTGDKGYKLADVKNGKVSMADFVAQLDNTELEAISRGDYVMNSPLGAAGNAGTFGGVLKSMRDKGIPAVTTTDGPSGIRINEGASLLPVATALACSWNLELVENLYEQVGIEMKRVGSHILLAPGMNIHRTPLCGRNFEYFSEDPLVTGYMAAAIVKGVQKAGVSACPKHFACNNQETNRTHNDSRVSERALREIYLKGFEICVKTANPQNIMTSYNKINGVWGHYNYELCVRILRGEWGYKGCIMTDWWMRSSKSPEFPLIRDQAYRVRAGVNVLMPGGGRTGIRKPDGTLLRTLGKPEGITLGELQRNAAEVLCFIMNSEAMNK